MRPTFLLLALLFTGCQTKVYDQGKPAVAIGSNFKGTMSYESKTLKWAMNGTLNNSTPTRAVGSIVATVGSDVVAGLVPGSGIVPIVGRAATATIPHIGTTTTNTAP